MDSIIELAFVVALFSGKNINAMTDERFSALENNVFTLENKLRQLEQVIQTQKMEINDLRNRNLDMADHLFAGKNQQQEDLSVLNSNDSIQSGLIFDANFTDVQLKSSLSGISSSSHKIKRSVTQPAFHAYIGRASCVNENQLIVYDVELLDNGNGYNNYDGIFEPPLSGIYIFIWTVAAEYYSKFTAELVVNGRVRGVTKTYPHNYGIHPASGVAILQVQAGDNIYIRRGSWGYGCSIAKEDRARNTFSGWMLS